MNQQKGFTLIELLIIIAIIGLLATMATTSLKNAQDKARLTRCRADFKQILTAIDVKREQYNNVLLSVTGSGCSDCSCRPLSEASLETSACVSRMTTTFQNLGFNGLLKDPWGHPYLIDENEQEGGSCANHDSLCSFGSPCGCVAVPFYVCQGF